MKYAKTYRMDAQSLAKLAALRTANPSQNDTELIRIAIDLLYAKGCPLINPPQQQDVERAYTASEIQVAGCNVLDSSIDQQKDILNELYMMTLGT